MRDASVEPTITGFSLTRYNTLLVVVAGLASAAFLYLGTGLHPTWWLLWVAPVPVLAIAPRLRGSAAFLFGSVAWILGEMNQWNYVRHEIELPLTDHSPLLCSPRCCLRSRRLVHAKLPATRMALHRSVRFPGLLGHMRISQCDRVASQHMGQSRLHANGFSAADPDRFGHWPLGNQLRRVFVCRRGCSPLQRRRQTMATSRVSRSLLA